MLEPEGVAGSGATYDVSTKAVPCALHETDRRAKI